MRVALLIQVAFFLGCGGIVAENGADPSGTPAVAAGDDAGAGSSDVGSPPPPSTPPSTPGPACTKTTGRVLVDLAGDGFAASCEGFTSGERTVTGRIVSTDVSMIKVDACHPSADCVPRIAYVTVKAPGLDLRSMKMGSFVQVSAKFTRGWTCTSRVTIASLADWGGLKNPVDVAKTYLVASDGEYGAAPPFEVNLVKSGCFTRAEPSCGAGRLEMDWYRLQFVPRGPGAKSSRTIAMGETATFDAGGQTFTARNLRAFYEGWCDAYWDFAWWATSF